MRKRLLLICTAVLVGLSAEAGGQSSPEVVVPGRLVGTSTIFLIDSSESMEEEYDIARRATIHILSRPVDEWDVRIYAFASDILAEPQGWVELPDSESVTAIDQWLSTVHVSGGTSMASAIETVVSENSDVPDVNMVIVTDGQPASPNMVREVAAALDLQIHLYGVSGVKVDLLRDLAEGSGGLYVEERRSW